MAAATGASPRSARRARSRAAKTSREARGGGQQRPRQRAEFRGGRPPEKQTYKRAPLLLPVSPPPLPRGQKRMNIRIIGARKKKNGNLPSKSRLTTLSMGTTSKPRSVFGHTTGLKRWVPPAVPECMTSVDRLACAGGTGHEGRPGGGSLIPGADSDQDRCRPAVETPLRRTRPLISEDGVGPTHPPAGGRHRHRRGSAPLLRARPRGTAALGRRAPHDAGSTAGEQPHSRPLP